jgi:hypothetical protein
VTYDLSRICATSAIALVSLMLVTVNPMIGIAATLEEVAHCRGLEKVAQRVSCFELLKQGSKAKAGGPAAPETEDRASAKSAGRPTVRSQGAATPNGNDVTRAKTKPSIAAKPVVPTQGESAAPSQEAVPGQGERAPSAEIEPAAVTERQRGALAKIKQSSRAKSDKTAPPRVEPAPRQEAAPEQAPAQGPLGDKRRPASAKIREAIPAKIDSGSPVSPDLPAKGNQAPPAPQDLAAPAPIRQTAPGQAAPPARTEQAAPVITEQAVPAQSRQVAPPQTGLAFPGQAEPDIQSERVSPQTDQSGSLQIGQGVLSSTGKAVFPPVAVFPPTGLQPEQAGSPPIDVGLPPAEQDTTPQTEQTASPKPEPGSQSQTREAASPSTTDDPATTSSIHRAGPAGQPLCIDPDALAVMLVAGLLTSNPEKANTDGCRILPDDATLTRLESYPSIFPSMRIVRVKVASPTQPDLTFGFTIETGR